jgi:hypothetical protein
MAKLTGTSTEVVEVKAATFIVLASEADVLVEALDSFYDTDERNRIARELSNVIGEAFDL